MALSIVNQPFWDLHWFHIAKKSKKLSKLLISGDGGDELFGGYTFRYEKFLSLINQDSTPHEKVLAYLQCHERDWVPDQENIFSEQTNFSWNDIYSIIKPYFENSLSPLKQVFLADFNGKLLKNMAPLYEKFHNFFNVKYLAPILSKDLILFSTTLPNEQKYDVNKKLGKLILRQILEKHHLTYLINEKKQGFSVNTVNLWKKYGQKICKYYLEDGIIIKDDIVNPEWISKYIGNSDLEPRYINKFLGLLALEIWYRLINNEITAQEKLET